MSDYRRAQVPGATYFFTVNLRDRRSKVAWISHWWKTLRGFLPYDEVA